MTEVKARFTCEHCNVAHSYGCVNHAEQYFYQMTEAEWTSAEGDKSTERLDLCEKCIEVEANLFAAEVENAYPEEARGDDLTGGGGSE